MKIRIEPLDRAAPTYRLLSWLLFPAIVAATLLVAIHLYQRGMEAPTVIGLSGMFAMAVIAYYEFRLPFRAEWNRNHGDIGADVLHNILSSYLPREVLKLVYYSLLAGGAVAVSAHVQGGLWRSVAGEWPFALQVAAVMVVAEFFDYWTHRVSHEWPLLWRLHAVHHNPQRLYWLNAGRDHPIAAMMFFVTVSGPLIALGVPPEVLLMYYVMESVLGLLQHCNIDLRLGPLNYVFSTVDLHRWHHAIEPREANTNYGSNLIVWDLVFGTWYFPGREGPAEIGVHNPQMGSSWWAHMLVPFRWKRLVAATDAATGRSAPA